MPLNIPTAQAPSWGLERLAVEAPYYKARGEYYKEAATKAKEATQERLDIRAATERATKPGEPMAMQSPGGQFMLSLGHAPSTINQLDVISELEKTNPAAAETLKGHYMNQLEKDQKFNDAQQSRKFGNVLTGMMMLDSGATGQAQTLLSQAIPDLAAVQKVGANDMAFQHKNGQIEVINVPKYIASLQTAKDLFDASTKMKIHILSLQKDLKAESIKAGNVVLPNGTQMPVKQMYDAYNDQMKPVISFFSNPNSIAIEKMNPEYYAKMMGKANEMMGTTPEEWIRKTFHVDVTGAEAARAIPGEKVKGGRPGSMIPRTPGGTGLKPVDLPSSKEDLKGNTLYQTSRGPALWDEDSQQFVAQ